MVQAALVDIDGTLIDSNLLYVLAWRRAFQRVGKQVTANDILHKIGMGGDKLVPAILGTDDQRTADQIRHFYRQEFRGKGLVEHAEATPGAAEMLRALKARGIRVALASSAEQEDVEQYLEQLGGQQAAEVVATRADVAATKPDADLFVAALEKLGRPSRALVIGDTVYDIEAAGKLGLPCVCVLSGGIEREVLERAGAAAIYESPTDVLADLESVLNILDNGTPIPKIAT
jgi:HAD superfamily hydrolase (TIGR01549 family)